MKFIAARTAAFVITTLMAPTLFAQATASPTPAALLLPTPTATPTSAPTATPSPSPSATPIVIQATPTPEPPPSPAAKKNSKWLDDHKKACERYYTGKIQAGIRRSCQVGGVLVDRYLDQPVRVAEAGCRLQYGEEPGETFSCLIGTKIARELDKGTTRYLTDLQLCSESYPVRTELDTYLLETCLVGIHAQSFMAPLSRFELCKSITPERSFLGPCAVGASLNTAGAVARTTAANSTTGPSHRALCEKYFDHLRFHMGYRNCLNARAVSPAGEPKPLTLDEIRGRCDTIVSDNGNDHERGACVIGAVLLETQRKGMSTAMFDACGATQVRYEDRDILGCLAAGSFLTYSNAATADRLCREVFREKKSLARSGCINAIATLEKSAKQSKASAKE
ncbi:hypothetical protein BH10BDE1_BH10BDE1_08640 [soil metagenome]